MIHITSRKGHFWNGKNRQDHLSYSNRKFPTIPTWPIRQNISVEFSSFKKTNTMVKRVTSGVRGPGRSRGLLPKPVNPEKWILAKQAMNDPKNRKKSQVKPEADPTKKMVKDLMGLIMWKWGESANGFLFSGIFVRVAISSISMKIDFKVLWLILLKF